jgi:hypothetical protein
MHYIKILGLRTHCYYLCFLGVVSILLLPPAAVGVYLSLAEDSLTLGGVFRLCIKWILTISYEYYNILECYRAYYDQIFATVSHSQNAACDKLAIPAAFCP